MTRQLLVGALALWAMLHAGAAAAEPQLYVADLMPLTVQDDAQSRLSLLVYVSGSGPGPSALHAAVKELKGPDGLSLPTTLLDVATESAALSEQGTRIFLKPELTGFRRPGDYLAVVQLGAGATTKLVTVTLRREPPSLHAEPLSLRLTRPLPWRPARLQVAYSIENRGQRLLHDLALDPQPLLRAEKTDGAAELGVGSLTVVLPPPLPGEALKRQRTGQALELAAGGRLDFSILFSDLSGVGRFKTGLLLRSADLGSPQTLPIAVEVVDRWEFALAAVGLGVLLSLLFHMLSGRWRATAENRYRIAHLAHEIEELRTTGAGSSTMRAGFAEKLRRAAQRNHDGEVTLCLRLLDEIDAGIDEYRGAQNELRMAVRERLEHATTQARLMLSQNVTLAPEQHARLKQLRLELERCATLSGTEQLEAADENLKLVQEQLLGLRKALTAPDPDAATLHAEAQLSVSAEAPGVRIEVLEPAARWRVGSALRVRILDERPGRAEGDQYVWRFGVGTPEAGAAEIEYPLDKAGDVEVQVTVRRPEGSEVTTARRLLHVLGPRPEIDLDDAPNPKLKAQMVLTLISLVAAGLLGVYFLCFSSLLSPLLGQSFGTPLHYLAGLAWGLVFDVFLRGFSDMLTRLSADSW